MATTDKELEKNATCATSTCGSTKQDQQQLQQAKLEAEKKAQAEKKQSGGCCGG